MPEAQIPFSFDSSDVRVVGPLEAISLWSSLTVSRLLPIDWRNTGWFSCPADESTHSSRYSVVVDKLGFVGGAGEGFKRAATRWFLSSEVYPNFRHHTSVSFFSCLQSFRSWGGSFSFFRGFRISKSYGAGAAAAAGMWKECGGGAAGDQFAGASTRGFGGVEQHSVPDLRRLQQVSRHSHRSGFRHSSSCMENASPLYPKLLFYWRGCCGGELRSSLGRRVHHYRSTTFPSSLSPPTHPILLIEKQKPVPIFLHQFLRTS